MLHLGAEVGPVEVAESDGQGPADLVAVAGPDAPARGPDRTATRETGVEQAILDHVPGKDDVGPVADLQPGRHLQTPSLEPVHFLDHLGRVEHDAAGDHAGHARAEDATGDDRQLPGLPAEHDRVAGIRPAGVADDDIVGFGEDVDELALGLVAPLQADHAGAGHGLEVLTTR